MTAKVAGKPAGKTMSDFRAAHDKSFIVPKKIREGIASLGDAWEYELEFQRRCGISQTDFAPYRDEFADFFFQIGGKNPKRIWCGTKSLATKLREMA